MSMAAEPSTPTVRSAIAGLLAFLALLVYWPVRSGEFVSDDFRFIVDHTAQLTRADTPGAFFSDPATIATPPDPDIWRPLRTWSYSIELQTFGLDPHGFHGVSMALHALVVVLLFHWLVALVGTISAACAAALFCVHPLATEAVAWISSRADLLVAAFVLGSLLFARRCERTRRGWIGLALLAIGAGLAKESGVMLPALYVLDVRMRRQTWLPRDCRAPLVALAIGAAVYLALYCVAFRPGIRAQVDWYGGSVATHFPFALLGLATMLRLVVWPVDQHFLWEPALFSPAPAAIVWGGLAAAALVVGLVVAARRRIPLVGLGVAWFFVALLPAANVLLPMRTMLAERFAYVPMIGIAAALAGALRSVSSVARLASTAVLVAVLGTLTWQRAADFATPRSLYEATLRSWPKSSSALMGLAELDRERGAYAAAAAGFDAAAEAALPDVAQSWRCRLAAAASRLSHGEFERAAREYERFFHAVETEARVAHACATLVPEALYRLGQALGLAGELNAAAARFEELSRHEPPRAEWFDAWGELERARGDSRAAIAQFTRALEIDADHHPARLHRASILADYPALRAQALADLREILVRDPTYVRAREALTALEDRPAGP
ncbi:MAG: hypothetical protein IPH13_07100 [Planctomycetes bacterium]|nr:hypothetical protein [Planctomycetota bacterium]